MESVVDEEKSGGFKRLPRSGLVQHLIMRLLRCHK